MSAISFASTVLYVLNETDKVQGRINKRLDDDMRALLEAANIDAKAIAASLKAVSHAIGKVEHAAHLSFLNGLLDQVKEVAKKKGCNSGAAVSAFLAPWRQNVANCIYRLAGVTSIAQDRKAAEAARKLAPMPKGGQMPASAASAANDTGEEYAESAEKVNRAIDKADASLAVSMFRRLMALVETGKLTAADKRDAQRALEALERMAA